MIPSIIDMYMVTFDSNEYQATTLFLLEKSYHEDVTKGGKHFQSLGKKKTNIVINDCKCENYDIEPLDFHLDL